MEPGESAVAAWLGALEQTALATAVRESPWLYPAAEFAHILGFVLLVGAAAMFDLRLLGLSRTLPVTEMAAHLLPWARAGLLLAAPTGALMFISDATATAANPAFRLKLLLVAAGILNAWAFHRGRSARCRRGTTVPRLRPRPGRPPSSRSCSGSQRSPPAASSPTSEPPALPRSGAAGGGNRRSRLIAYV